MNILLQIVLFFCCLSSSTVHSQGGQPHQEKPRTSYARHEPTPKGGVPGVIELSSVKLDKHIRDGSIWLIEFYAPWCRYCNSFAMTYAQIAHDVHEKNPNREREIHVAKINGDRERAAASRFGVSSYPVFFLVDGWSVYKYEGSRSLETIVKFVEGGYKDQSPLPIWSSPMGPLGLVHAAIFYAGNAVFSWYTFLLEEKGLSAPVAAFVFAFGAMLMALVTMVTVAIMLSAKVKED